MTVFNKVLIMGYGKSGKAVEKFLLKKNVEFYIYDKQVYNDGYFLKKLNKKLIKTFDLIVISPGISIYNKYIQFAIKNNIKVVSELEFGYWYLSKKTKLIAITGTNGKTTTTHLLNESIRTLGNNCETVGNVGKPLTDYCDKDYDYLVCEVSSFQLEAIDTFKPDIAVILNVAEDHTDRHLTFENYVDSKFRLLKNNPRLTVLNFDDDIVKEKAKFFETKKKYFSVFEKSNIYINKQEEIVLCKNGKNMVLGCAKDINIPPVFLPDVLAVILVLSELNFDANIIFEVLNNFDYLSHKCELMTTNNNILFINDSKATNIHAMMKELETCKNPTILLLGGTDKQLNFDIFFHRIYMYNLKQIICFGEAKKRIVKSAKKFKYNKIIKVPHLKDAVQTAIQIAKEKDIVLFSPACSSFDEFNGYKERGEYFKKLVYDYLSGSCYENK